MISQQQASPYPQQGEPQPMQPMQPMNYTMVQYLPDYRYMQAFQQSQAEIARLQNQLERKILKEEELRQVLLMQGSAYFSIIASGRTVQLTHFIFNAERR